jgi:DNA-binding CsgD family transcriptional regulator/tetratricopeptide (TPR) repeat protein
VAATRRTSPLLGRARELGKLTSWVTEAAAGRGRAVLIEGEPGIGKSELVRAACAEATVLGCQVFWGAGDELGQELPLLPLTYGLQVRDLPADPRRSVIAGLLRGETAGGKAVDMSAAAAEQILVLVDELCAVAPTVLVVDDLQWADEATVALWRRLARSARQLPLLLVGAMRPVPQRDPLLALRAALDPADRIRLGPLPEAAAADLVAELTGGQPGAELLRLAEDAAGNPLYLTELLAALLRTESVAVDAAGAARLTGSRIPGSLAEAIADRLAFLPMSVRAVLRVAALIGVDFSISDLITVSGKDLAELLPALDDAVTAGVVTESGSDLAFRHPLIRTALYEQMPEPVRAAWHRSAGKALVEASAPVDRIARQLLPAYCSPGGAAEPMDAWAVRWLREAAPVLTGHSPRAAVDLLRRAVITPTGAGAADVLGCRLAEALYRTGATAEAEKVASRALERVTDPDLVVDLHWTLAQCRALAGRTDESIAALEGALAGGELAARHRARLRVLVARSHRDAGRVDTASRAATEALSEGWMIGDQWTVGWALHVLTLVAMTRGEAAQALPLFEQALAVTRSDPALTDLRLLLLINQAVTLGDLDRYPGAFDAAHEVRALADRTGSLIRLVQAHSALGQLYLETGQWDEALVEVDVLPADCKDPSVVCCDNGVAAVIGFHRGDPATARRHLAAAELAADRIGGRVVANYTLAQALDHEHDDAPATALAVLDGALARDADVEELLVDTVRLATRIGARDTATLAAGRMEALAAALPDIPHRQGAALFCRGLVDSDPTALLRAAEQYELAERPLPKAQALEAAALAFAGSGGTGSGQAAFTRALDGYTALHANWDMARLQAQFRSYGIRRSPRVRPKRPQTGWESLTPTEARIAAMVAEGLSNPKIATALFLSPRTVATHVSHILTKLRVPSRIDIAREAGRRQSAS